MNNVELPGVPVNRNDLCPCGSGRRYKHCHGSVGDPGAALLDAALAAYQSGALRRAEALFRQALAEKPNDAAATDGLAAVLYERFRYTEALGLYRDVAERSGWADAASRRNLGLVVAKLLGPEANARQGELVARYLERGRALRAAPALAVRIGVVLLGNGDRRAVERSLDSVAAQDSRDLELIVVDDADKGIDATNRAAAAAGADYLAFIGAGDRFAPDRIERIASAVARERGAWGFSRVDYDFEDAHGRAEHETRAWDAPTSELPSFALAYRDLAGADGNLFVARELFAALGGFRDVDDRGWDFCWRASRVAEPVVVDERLYVVGGRDRVRGALPRDPQVLEMIEREHQQHVAEALTGDAEVANEFSPQLPANRILLLQTELRAGRGDRIPVSVLKSVADEWRTRVETHREETSSGAGSVAGASSSGRIALVVLGVYRSGTSALTRVLNLCGAALPQNLIAARPDANRKGFWEPEAIVDLDAQMLRRLAVAWDSPDVRLPAAGTIVDEFVATAGDVLANEYGDAPLVLLKDPRLCVLAPLWHRALHERGYRPTYIVSVRHPLEVARSLAHSLRSYEGLALSRGLALWRGYMEPVEAFVAGTEARFVHLRYDDLLDDWRRVVERIARRLDVPLDVESRAGEIDRFLERDLRSQQIGERSLALPVPDNDSDAMLALYARLLERCGRDAR